MIQISHLASKILTLLTPRQASMSRQSLEMSEHNASSIDDDIDSGFYIRRHVVISSPTKQNIDMFLEC
ncbi:hypothetical protein DPMN_180139 [Dreissena polymorpha]|uniref:Uncharacterized protein n=1 Tax=Dreissena polymorpha TaxID=45954 RepID=A0A9D4IMV2_DREPO|nr:hypothetical protein DPMN_180139 [Dreissena polymorpha]